MMDLIKSAFAELAIGERRTGYRRKKGVSVGSGRSEGVSAMARHVNHMPLPTAPAPEIKADRYKGVAATRNLPLATHHYRKR